MWRREVLHGGHRGLELMRHLHLHLHLLVWCQEALLQLLRRGREALLGGGREL